MEEALLTGRVDEGVDAERRHLERRPDLPEAIPLAELVDRSKTVGHETSPVVFAGQSERFMERHRGPTASRVVRARGSEPGFAHRL